MSTSVSLAQARYPDQSVVVYHQGAVTEGRLATPPFQVVAPGYLMHPTQHGTLQCMRLVVQGHVPRHSEPLYSHPARAPTPSCMSGVMNVYVDIDGALVVRRVPGPGGVPTRKVGGGRDMDDFR